MAAPSTQIQTLPIKLTGAPGNYNSWAWQTQNALQSLALWNYTGAPAGTYIPCPGFVDPAAPTAKERANRLNWDGVNSRAYGMMMASMEEVIGRQLEQLVVTTVGTGNVLTAQALWNNARDLYDVQNASTTFHHFQTVVNWRMADRAPMAQIAHIEMLHRCLEGAGQTLPDLTKCLLLLNALPNKWQPMIMGQVLQQQLATITWQAVVDAISWHWDALQSQHHPSALPLATRISAVQKKPAANPTWQSQMRSGGKKPQEGAHPQDHSTFAPGGSSSGGSTAKPYKKKRSGRGVHAKSKPGFHFVETPSMPAHSSTIMSLISPEGRKDRMVHMTAPVPEPEGINGPWPSFNTACTILNDLGRRHSIQEFQTTETAVMNHLPSQDPRRCP